MASKYLKLPDVDQSSPDIYETPDPQLPTAGSGQHETRPNEAIDASGLSVAESKTLFSAKEVYASEDVDFSDQLGKHKAFYWTRSVPETAEAKLARLTREVAELQDTLSADSSSAAGSTATDRENVVELTEVLAKLQVRPVPGEKFYKNLGEKPASERSEQSVAEDKESKEVSRVPPNTAQIARLEARITELEAKLGNSIVSSPELSRPIGVSIMDLTRKLSLFTNDFNAISQATANLKEVSELTESIRLQQSPGLESRPSDRLESTIPEQSQIASLYAKLQAVDRFLPVLPSIIQRLRSLQVIHADAAEAHSRLKSVTSTVDLLKTDITQWRQSLEAVEAKISESSSAAGTNIAEIKQWLDQVESRLKRLPSE